jgi:putative endonuclease
MSIFVGGHPGGQSGRLAGMTNSNQIVGRFGERIAARHLLRQGLTLLERNWRCPSGEVDLVARDGPELVFVEVKTRRGTRFGRPAEAIVAAKARRMRATAVQWLAAHRDADRGPVRFDVIGIVLGRDTLTLEHLRRVL